ncbi:hypothetical protein CC79DRAFT_157402 [Sarocladium strictum]
MSDNRADCATSFASFTSTACYCVIEVSIVYCFSSSAMRRTICYGLANRLLSRLALHLGSSASSITAC